MNDAAASRGLEGRRQCDGERLVELDLDAGGVAILHVHGELDAPAADAALHARANAPFGVGKCLRHAELQIEMPMVDRPNGHRDGGVSVSRVADANPVMLLIMFSRGPRARSTPLACGPAPAPRRSRPSRFGSSSCILYRAA